MKYKKDVRKFCIGRRSTFDSTQRHQ